MISPRSTEMTSADEPEGSNASPARWERPLSTVLLAVVVLLAAWLRLDALGEPNYWLDEILGQDFLTRALALPWWEWIAGKDPRDGVIYHLVLLAARAGGDGEGAGRLPFALCGIAAVPLLWWTARRITGDSRAALAAAALLCVSPLHVYYSREVRPVVIVILLTVVLLHALTADRWRLAAVALLLMLFTSAAGMAVAAAAFFAALAAAQHLDEAARRRMQYAAGAAIVAAEVFPLLYAVARGEYASSGAFGGIDLALFDSVVRGLSVTALDAPQGGRVSWAMLAAAVAGAIALWRRNRAGAAVVTLMAALPVVLMIAALKLRNDAFSSRYVAPAVVAWVLLAGAGIAWFARFAGRRFAVPVTIVLTALMASQAWTNARLEPFRKLDWRSVANAVAAHARDRDVVVTADAAAQVQLTYYLRRTDRPVPVRMAKDASEAAAIVSGGRGRWLASVGYGADPSTRQWMCSQPLLLASPIGDFRLHYAPSIGDFLAHRASGSQRRAMAAAIAGRGRTIAMGPESDGLLGAGWFGAERAGTAYFRWAGAKASVVVPWSSPGDGVVRVRAVPFHQPSLPPQQLALVVNGRALPAQPLAEGWQELAYAVPRDAWTGPVNVIEFRFAFARQPAELDPASGDRRPLAAAVEWIAVDAADALRSDVLARPTPLPHVRIAADRFLEEQTSWRGGFTHFSPATLRKEQVERLLGRLGFDPVATWPRLAGGHVYLDEVVEILAQDLGCLDDPAFVRRAFTLLYDRPPWDHEERGMLGDLRGGVSRTRLLGRLVKTPEFRRSVTGGPQDLQDL